MSEGTEGQDRKSYSDTQDRESYVPDEDLEDDEDPDDELKDEDRHSVNCYFCGELFDERDGVPAETWNENDGGTACPRCAEERGRG